MCSPRSVFSLQLKLYNSVIDDVISGVREAFLDEGVDDQVLQELKQLWEQKLLSNKAVEPNPEPLDHAPPQMGQKSNSKSGMSQVLCYLLTVIVQLWFLSPKLSIALKQFSLDNMWVLRYLYVTP